MQYSSAVLKRTCRQVVIDESTECEFMFVEKVQNWMESDDSVLAQLVGYGVSGLAVLYLAGCVIRAVLV